MSADCPKVLRSVAVIAMIGIRNRLRVGNRADISSVSPLLDRASKTSCSCRQPKSPCTASAGCRKWARVPVEESVAASFCPISPAFPMPQTITLPEQFSSKSTAAQNPASSFRETSTSAFRLQPQNLAGIAQLIELRIRYQLLCCRHDRSS